MNVIDSDVSRCSCGSWTITGRGCDVCASIRYATRVVRVDDRRRPDSTHWPTCGAGHDLSRPGAYLYDGSGRRECRSCANARKQPRRKAA